MELWTNVKLLHIFDSANGELWIQSSHGLQKTAILKGSPLHLDEGCQRGRSNQTMKKVTIDPVEDTLGLTLES